MNNNAMDMRYLEIRSWPERSDVVVMDRASGMPLAHYDLSDIPEGKESSPLFVVSMPWEERAKAALSSLEEYDQELLHAHFGLEEDVQLQLAADPEPRERLEHVLADHDLTLADVEFGNLPRLVDRLERMGIEDLWRLMSDWYDVSARRYPAGISRREPDSWVHRAHPDKAEHYLHISRGDKESARILFMEQVNVPIEQLTLFEIICWVYFSRTEFANDEPFPIDALTSLAT